MNGHTKDVTLPRRRLPNIHDALPFSPFSSIVPFSPDIIPPPVAAPATLSTNFLAEEDRLRARTVLNALNAEAANAERASDRLQQTISGVRKFLDVDNLTQFQFKTSRRMTTSQVFDAPTNGHRQVTRGPNIGTFAKMVQTAADVPVRYPTPTSPSSPPPQRTPSASTAPRPKTGSPRTPTPSVRVAANVPRNFTPRATPQKQLPVKPVARTPIVAIPRLSLTAAERAQCEVFDSNDIAHEHINGRTHSTEQASGGADNQSRAHAAVAKLQGLLTDLFEAQTEFQQDGSGYADAHRSFHQVEAFEGGIVILQHSVQRELDKTVAKVANAGLLAQLPLEDLSRLQKMCENSIVAASTARLNIGDGWDERDQTEWSGRVGIAEQALTASKTVLRIMTAGREEKQLFSEDTLRLLLDMFARTVQACIISVVEYSTQGGSAEQFRTASMHSKVLLPVFIGSTKVLSLLANLFVKTDVDETATTAAEYLCRSLIFVENATAEKDSVLGIQKFESVRRAAMDLLANIFARNQEQRQYIFDSVLISLEKLPVTRQSARQFKLVDSKPIQLVSALLMRLVQTSATRSEASMRDQNGEQSSDEDADGVSNESDEYDSDDSRMPKRKAKRITGKMALNNSLESFVTPLSDAAKRDANYIINFLLSRALTSSKSSDEPYRNLLDIFTEDFLGVLGNSDWPAAELLLRSLVGRLLELFDNNKSSAPAKAMALELMGSMLSGITDLQLQLSKTQSLGADDTDLHAKLKRLQAAITAEEASDADLCSFDGPYRVYLEYMQRRYDTEAQVRSAIGYVLTQWGQLALGSRAGPIDLLADTPGADSKDLNKRIATLIRDPQWLDNESDFPSISTEEGHLAAKIVTMRLPFCKAFSRIFMKLLNSMSSDQPSLRSKSLRSVDQVLEKDPSILDRGNFVMNNILRCLSDPSPQVRDSALGLLGKCLLLRPQLDAMVYEGVLARTGDAAGGVKKRAMKMLRDQYLRTESPQTKAKMADALIHRIADVEPTIVQLAQQLLEEIWMTPFYSIAGQAADSVQLKMQLRQQTALLVDVVQRSETVSDTLRDLLQGMLTDEAKTATMNKAVCTALIKTMFDAIVDPAELPGERSQASVLQTLAVFAQAKPTLFASSQVQTLLPYLKNLASIDDLMVYRYAIVVLRHTLPHVASVPVAVLADLQNALMASVQKLAKGELKEVAACLWTLNGMLDNPDKLVKVTRSALEGLQQRRNLDLQTNQQAANQVRRLILIIGHFVSAFNLDPHAQAFIEKFPSFKSSSVAALAIDTICTLTSPKQPLLIRENALESMCLICEAWPLQYLRTDVCNAMELVFQGKEAVLEQALLASFKDLFGSKEKKSAGGEEPKATGVKAGKDRLGNTYLATDKDGASTSIAQRFLPDIIRIALTASGALALIATQVVVSVNTSGLVHPNQSAACLVALGTSPNTTIASIAYQEHRSQFSKHETMYEKENIRAIQQAYTYQAEVVGNTAGFTGNPPVPKLQLFWEVMKPAGAKTRKNFLKNICTRLDFEPAKLEVSADLPFRVDLTRFCAENLALFDYPRLDELQQLVAGLEKVVAGTGTAIAHGIETLLLQNTMEEHDASGLGSAPSILSSTADAIIISPAPALARPPPIDPQTLRSLTAASQVLTLLWDTRTYLKRLWNLAKPANARGPGRPPAAGKAKDVAAKAPTRIPNAVALTERYLARNAEIVAALASPDAQTRLCRQFQGVMAIDDDIKVVSADADNDDLMMVDEDGYATSEGSSKGSAIKRGRKRKSGSATPAGTPSKRRRAGRKTKAAVDNDDAAYE